MSEGGGEKPESELTEEEKEKRIAQEERAAIPATFVDTWSFLPFRGHMRIVLGESLYRGDYYRAAFVMELDEAEMFARHLLRAVERRRTRDIEQAAKRPDDDGAP